MSPNTIARVWTWQHVRAGRYTCNGWSVYEMSFGAGGWFASANVSGKLMQIGPCLTREAAMDAAMGGGA